MSGDGYIVTMINTANAATKRPEQSRCWTDCGIMAWCTSAHARENTIVLPRRLHPPYVM
ncbi:hypothetical protein BAUCODRAFT_124253 [Baudoinia panamericana UAMH 10762]|uniref:Uncharacterized protein n=1 Tax=Baudoinia panamericana (strain UAMH 10762) TaxID=717646 RepID=M2MSZ9_BAUPA|nr:uncharacterized protein BAUCODRAFT_124253 [Baudoinia panamericana UAMH 10762]EMC94643.1 hypothetical protein BAUCODRAFT_124253 [Baudoinia panamericana UAMH 10762]